MALTRTSTRTQWQQHDSGRHPLPQHQHQHQHQQQEQYTLTHSLSLALSPLYGSHSLLYSLSLSECQSSCCCFFPYLKFGVFFASFRVVFLFFFLVFHFFLLIFLCLIFGLLPCHVECEMRTLPEYKMYTHTHTLNFLIFSYFFIFLLQCVKTPKGRWIFFCCCLWQR